jgi:hypothetical protein
VTAVVHHLPPSAVDALRRLVGCSITVKILHGHLQDDSLTADDVVILVWAGTDRKRPSEISRALFLSGSIERLSWISMSLDEHPASSLVDDGLLHRYKPERPLQLTHGFFLHPTIKARVTSVDLYDETFTTEADEPSRPGRPVTITAEARIDISFDKGDPICFEIGAFGVGFFHVHRSTSKWSGCDPAGVALRHSFTIPVHAYN